MRRAICKAFTLIELLVVISIISLLVSILLPSLSTARDIARNVVCMSNLRNIASWGNMYATDYNGVLPTHADTSASMADRTWTSLSSTSWLEKSADDGLFVSGSKSGTVMHCPQAVSSVQPLRSSPRGANYGLNYYVGGGKSSTASNSDVPELSDLNAYVFWFGDACIFPSGSQWDFYPVLQIWSSVPGGVDWPWTWPDGSRSAFGGHPKNVTNFAFGDCHVESISENTYMDYSSSERNSFLKP